MSQEIVIVDYQTGNMNSVAKVLQRLNTVHVSISNDEGKIRSADKIILPGVGHFGNAMNTLTNLGLIDALNKHALTNKKPILGICLGMQLMASASAEGNCEGLNWIPGKVERLQVTNSTQFKIPHNGWNTLNTVKQNAILSGISSEEAFYFVHAYHFKPIDLTDVLCTSTYENSFVSGIARENIIGVQFHPEKSHDQGIQLFQNFIQL
jgi:glutamine amidotransferase